MSSAVDSGVAWHRRAYHLIGVSAPDAPGKAGLLRYGRHRGWTAAENLVVDILGKVIDSRYDFVHAFRLGVGGYRWLVSGQWQHLGIYTDAISKNSDAAKKYVIRTQGRTHLSGEGLIQHPFMPSYGLFDHLLLQDFHLTFPGKAAG